MIYKSDYRPRYPGYRAVYALVTIADGIVGLIVWPFGYSSGILTDFCAYNLRKDVERAKARREAAKAKLQK
jgi:hypothetical protein